MAALGKGKGKGKRNGLPRATLAVPRMGTQPKELPEGQGDATHQTGAGGPQQWKGHGGGKQGHTGEGQGFK